MKKSLFYSLLAGLSLLISGATINEAKAECNQSLPGICDDDTSVYGDDGPTDVFDGNDACLDSGPVDDITPQENTTNTNDMNQYYNNMP